jgi:phage terminase large subunit GpA-like protein
MSISAKAAALFRRVLQAALPPPPREAIWRFLEKVVVIPQIAGSRASGPIDTSVMPIWRGLLERYARPHVHYFTLAKGARVGGTLFFAICLIIEKILRWPGPIGWVDPTGKTAKSVSRREIEPYFQACAPVIKLAMLGKTTWTWAEKFFSNCLFSILGAGSINDFGGRQWELVIINEQDRIPDRSKDSPTPSNEAEVRSSQFEQTRKIVRNSTPFSEGGLTWGEFIAGSQEHGYCPCPECGGYQRLTFFKEPAEPDRWMRVEASDPILAAPGSKVPINHDVPGTRGADTQRREPKHIKPSRDNTFLVKGIPETGRVWWPPECKDKRSGRWDVDKVARAARYECAFCQAKIRPEQLEIMRERYELRAHNIFASRDHVSAQVSSMWSPWVSIGAIAKVWLLAQGSASKLRGFFNLILGMPAPAAPTKVTPKHLALIQRESPRYFRQFPEILDGPALVLLARPVLLTCQADVQQDGIWYTIRALYENGARAVLAWGHCGGFTELDRIAAREWTFDHGANCHPALRLETFSCYTTIGGNDLATCIIDTGWKTKRAGGVYEFIHEQGGRWLGVKGGAFAALGKEKPIAEETFTFNYAGSKLPAAQVDVAVINQNDFILSEHFSRFVLKERRPPGYHLPVDLDDHFIEQITAPYLAKNKLADGRTVDVWRFETDPHLYDCEKYGEVLCFIFEPAVLAKLRERQDAARAMLVTRLATA